MSNLSSTSFASRFPQFAGTTPETFTENDPAKLKRAGVHTYIDPSIPVFKPKTDNSLIKVRCIPHPDKGYFAYEVRVHFGLGSQGHSVPCPSMRNENCPICEYRKELYNRGEKDLAAKFKYAVYHLFWVINREDEAKGPQLLAVTKNGIDRIRGILPDPDSGALRSIDSIERGRDLYFRKRKENEAADFFVMADFQLRDKETMLTDNAQKLDEWLTYIMDHQVSKSLKHVSADEIMRLAGLDKLQSQAQQSVSSTESEASVDRSNEPTVDPGLNEPPLSLQDQMAKVRAEISVYKK